MKAVTFRQIRDFFSPLAGLVGALVFMYGGSVLAAAASDRPNVILILTDDQGYGDVGINGNKQIRTPNLDRLAREGVQFNSFYVTPICATTRAGLMAGRYHQRTGVQWPFWGAEVLRHREVTIAEALKPAGYRNAIIGKWHLGRFNKYSPLHHGFDEFFGFRDGMIDDYQDGYLEHNGESVRTRGHMTEALTDAALRFVDANKDNPFFIYLAYNAPHLPHIAPWKFEEQYLKDGLPSGLAKLYANVSGVDEGVGRILAHLQKLQLDEKTIVLFMCDNGPQLDFSAQMSVMRSPDWDEIDGIWRGVNRYNAGMRGEKATVYEGGIRSPLFVRWPGRLTAGTTVDAVAAHIDIMPTVLDLTGSGVPKDLDLDGRSLQPLMQGTTHESPHEKLFFWVDPPVMGGKYGQLPDTAEMRYVPRNYAVRSGQWKLVGGKELYQLKDDPSEKNNLAEQHPEKLRELQAAFDQWAATAIRKEDLVRPPVPVDGKDNPSLMSNVFTGGTVIDIAWAQIHGENAPWYGYEKVIRDKITGWTNEKAFLRWELDVEQAGTYDVILQYGCDPKDAGSRIRITAGGDEVEGVVPSTGAADVWSYWTVGSLSLPKGRTNLDMTVRSIAGKEVLQLHEFRLQRTTGE